MTMTMTAAQYRRRRRERLQEIRLSAQIWYRTAVHEAGHAVAAYLLGLRFAKASIVLDMGATKSGGRVKGMRYPGRDAVAGNWKHIQNLFAGDVAVEFVLGWPMNRDLYQALGLDEGRRTGDFTFYDSIGGAPPPPGWWPKVGGLLYDLYQVRALLQDPRAVTAIRALAAELCRRGEVGEQQARAIIAPHLGKYMMSPRRARYLKEKGLTK